MNCLVLARLMLYNIDCIALSISIAILLIVKLNFKRNMISSKMSFIRTTQ